MKRKIILSIALILGIATLSLIISFSPVGAEPPQRYGWDTGVVKLGPNQILRITVNAGSGNDTIAVGFRRMEYMQSACSNGVCKLTLSAQNNSTPLLLMPGEAASIDIPNDAAAVRGTVLTNSRNARVTMIVFDTSTQRVVSYIAAELVTEDIV